MTTRQNPLQVGPPEFPVDKWCRLARAALFDLSRLAHSSGLSVRQLQRRMKQELGISPRDWMDEQRMVAARQLLIESDSIKRVAYELGYRHVAVFNRQFKKVYGMAPTDFLRLRSRIILVNFGRKEPATA
jgi:AraC-like DNA-binding protein